MRSLITALAVLGVGIWGLLVGALWRYQEAVLFPAPSVDVALLDAVAERIGAEAVRMVADDGQPLYAWLHPAQGRERGVVFYLHGNGETLNDTVSLQRELVQRGWTVFKLSPRGYPGSPGAPSEEGFRRDLTAAWAWLTTERGVDPSRVVIHGRSMGGGLAGHLLNSTSPGAVVLESTFTSTVAVARHRFPWAPAQWLLRHRFETGRSLQGLTVPTLVLHGAADRIVPVTEGRALARTGPHIAYVEEPRFDHNDGLVLRGPNAGPAYWAFLESFASGAMQ